MTKGHNKGRTKEDKAKGEHTPGQTTHLKEGNKDKSPNKGRNKDEDPSGGTKGKNSI